MKKIIAFFIRFNFVKKYLAARFNIFSSDATCSFDAKSIEYWVNYVLTGKLSCDNAEQDIIISGTDKNKKTEGCLYI